MKKVNLQTSYIGLVDCNNFFVSCERLFRPDLSHKPVLVLSANDGCVISRSKEVKDLGIPMGVPHFEIRDRIKADGITVFSSNFALYRDISKRVMQTVRSIASDSEVYSIDEAFFHVPQNDAEAVARTIKQRIEQWVGIPVSIGVGETKTIAKHMGTSAKKHTGVAIISPEARNTLYDVSLREIWGVGRKTYEKLERCGVRTVGDVLRTGAVYMRTHLGILGEQLYFELAGITTRTKKIRTHHQSIMSSASFGKKVKGAITIEDALSYHVAQVAEKARQDERVARDVSFSIRYEDADGATRIYTERVPLVPPSANTAYLTKAVLKAARPFFRSSFSYKKVGVVLSNVVTQEVVTGSLFFDTESVCSSDELMKVFDAINMKHGRGSVRMATVQKTHAWKGRSGFVSDAYTTSWTGLPLVAIE